jgi:hypothetical protein
MVSNKRVPAQQIVYGTPIVIDEDDTDLFNLNPQRVLVTKGGKFLYAKYDAPIPSGDGGNGSVGNVSGNTDTADQDTEGKPQASIKLDLPDLTDIEILPYEQYYDSLKRVRVKAIIKIKNSSVEGKEVEGVDARIYDPSS